MCSVRSVAALSIAAVFAACAHAQTSNDHANPASAPFACAEQEPGEGNAKNERPPRWFLLLAAVNAHPKLESEELVDRFYNRAMHLLAPGFDDAKTITDLRDDWLLWPPHIGVGRILSERVSVFVQAGYSCGKVRTKANDPSVLLLPLHTDFEIQRGAAYAGLGVDVFPFRMPELRRYSGVWQRLKEAKPSLGARLTCTHATYDAKAKAGFRPFGNFLSLELSDSWLLLSVNVNVGLDIPVNKRNALSFNAGYNFFFDREFDFEGPAYTVAWKRFFR